MTGGHQVLFIQGGGAGTHDDWDHRLVASLRRALGAESEVRYPRMPREEEPSPDAWCPAIRREVAELGDGAVAVGHSVGGTLLAAALTDGAGGPALAAIVLVAAPWVGDGGWTDAGFALPDDLGARLPHGVPVHVFHGLDDDTVPPAHAERYGRAIPRATVHLLPGRDHQMGDDLTEVAAVIGGA